MGNIEKEEQFKKGCPESAKIIADTTSMYEIKAILDALGRSHSEGYVKGTHLTSILEYLRRTKTESFRITKAKLALIVGINPRYLQEGYLDGIEAFGIIKLTTDESNDKIWEWIGIKAFKNNGSE